MSAITAKKKNAFEKDLVTIFIPYRFSNGLEQFFCYRTHLSYQITMSINMLLMHEHPHTVLNVFLHMYCTVSRCPIFDTDVMLRAATYNVWYSKGNDVQVTR